MTEPDDTAAPSAHPLARRKTRPDAGTRDSDFVARPGFRNPATAKSKARTKAKKGKK